MGDFHNSESDLDRFRFRLSIAALVVVLDHLAKWIAVRTLADFEPTALSIYRIFTGLLLFQYGVAKILKFPVLPYFANIPPLITAAGAIELVGIEPLFEPGAGSKTLVLRDTDEGWKFSVKFVPPIVRERNTK